jgi:enoyl-CoA hydratase/carnithine racemase
VRDDADVHVAVLRANGDRAFCTGIDVVEGAWWFHLPTFDQQDPGVSLGPKQHRVWKPVITAVHGMCAGGAFYFLNESDIIICSDDATFFDPHMNSGITSALEPAGLLARGVPLGDVLRWALTGNEERLTADTALRIGLVTEVLPREELWPKAHSLALEIAGRRPQAVQATVRAIWDLAEQTRSMRIHNGLMYTQLGNPTSRDDFVPQPKRTPRRR